MVQGNAVHWLTLLYGRSASVALAVAQRILRDRQEAEDILQDAFVAALNCAERMIRGGAPSCRGCSQSSAPSRSIVCGRARCAPSRRLPCATSSPYLSE